MKILHVYKTCYPETNGGIEQVIRYICKESTEKGISNTVITLGKENKEYEFEGCRIIVIKKQIEISSNGFSIALIQKFRKLSKEHDIIHYQYPWPTGDLLNLFSAQSNTIVSYQSDIVKQKFLKLLYRPLELFFLSSVNKIIASSPQYAESSENLKKFSSKVDVIPLGIDKNSYPNLNNGNVNFWKNKVGEGFFLFIGVFRYYKGLKYLLEAAKINKLPVVIAGDGPEKADLEKYISVNKLKNIKMIGLIGEQDKVSLHYLSKAFVFPSHLRSEAFGISLVEALMFSKPIISCDIGTGSSYVNIHNVTGLQVPPQNAMALSKAMIDIENDPTFVKNAGINGKKRFEKLFTSEMFGKEYIKQYKQFFSK